MNFGGISLGEGCFGGYTIDNKPATSLPQALASALPHINESLLGATYVPLWYVGHQLVNGTNYMLVCKEIRATREVTPMIVAMVINVPPMKPGVSPGENAKVVAIIEEANLTPELATIFSTSEKGLVGVSYKPIAYVGKQVVRGTNYYFLCEAKRIVANPTPYAVMLCINVFEGQCSVISIEQIEDSALGEWP